MRPSLFVNNSVPRCLAVLAAVSVAGPLLALCIQVTPAQVPSIQWRFGLGGIFGSTLVTPSLGLLGLLGLGVLGKHRKTLITTASISAFLLLLCAGVGAMFILDFLTVRGMVSESETQGLYRLSLSGLTSLLLASVSILALTISGVVVSRDARRRRTQDLMTIVARCAYVVFVATASGPLLGLLIQSWPLQLGSLQWRVGFAGLFPNATMLPAVGLFGCLWVAQTFSHRLGGWVFTAVSSTILGVLVITAVTYSSDFFTMRAEVLPEGLTLFDNAGLSTAVNLVLMLVVYSTFAWSGMAGLRSGAFKPQQEGESGQGWLKGVPST